MVIEKRNSANGCQMLFWDVPKEVKNKFKACCAKRGVSMREIAIRLMMYWTENMDTKLPHLDPSFSDSRPNKERTGEEKIG